MRKIFYLTGTRADYGLIRKTLLLLNQQDDIDLSLIVTGMHLENEFGATLKEIEGDKLKVIKKIRYPLFPQTGAVMALGISKIIEGCIQIFLENFPDLLLVLGDRGEMLAATIAAVHMNLPVVHIHGGERTGTIDESIRHAISKLAHYHFVSSENAKERLLKMGEPKQHIFVVGAPGLDGIGAFNKDRKKDLSSDFALDINKKWIIFLMHPVVQDQHDRFLETKFVVDTCLQTGSQIIALLPNSDAGGETIRAAVQTYQNNKNVRILGHIHRNIFLTLLSNCDLLIGNSSSGIIEAASFGIPVINIGNRQNLRDRNINVIDLKNNDERLLKAIYKQLNHGHYESRNLYQQNDTSRKIVTLLQKIKIDRNILNKSNAY